MQPKKCLPPSAPPASMAACLPGSLLTGFIASLWEPGPFDHDRPGQKQTIVDLIVTTMVYYTLPRLPLNMCINIS